MSGASKTNSPLVLYAEGVDPEADLVLVCGQRKFFVRRAVCDAFKVVESMPDKSSGAEFDVLGHSAKTLEKLLLLVDPDAAIALSANGISARSCSRDIIRLILRRPSTSPQRRKRFMLNHGVGAASQNAWNIAKSSGCRFLV